jgi:hypothetical protein
MLSRPQAEPAAERGQPRQLVRISPPEEDVQHRLAQALPAASLQQSLNRTTWPLRTTMTWCWWTAAAVLL